MAYLHNCACRLSANLFSVKYKATVSFKTTDNPILNICISLNPDRNRCTPLVEIITSMIGQIIRLMSRILSWPDTIRSGKKIASVICQSKVCC